LELIWIRINKKYSWFANVTAYHSPNHGDTDEHESRIVHLELTL